VKVAHSSALNLDLDRDSLLLSLAVSVTGWVNASYAQGQERLVYVEKMDHSGKFIPWEREFWAQRPLVAFVEILGCEQLHQKRCKNRTGDGLQKKLHRAL
jgi:hypothetical protein